MKNDHAADGRIDRMLFTLLGFSALSYLLFSSSNALGIISLIPILVIIYRQSRLGGSVRCRHLTEPEGFRSSPVPQVS